MSLPKPKHSYGGVVPPHDDAKRRQLTNKFDDAANEKNKPHKARYWGELTLLVYHDDDPDQCEYSASFKDAALHVVLQEVFTQCQLTPEDGCAWRADGKECAALFKQAEHALENHVASSWEEFHNGFEEEHEALESLVNILAQCIEGGKEWFIKCSVTGTRD